MFSGHVSPPDMNVTSDPVMPHITLPQVFKTTSAWSFTGSPFVSPSLGIKAGAIPPIKDPTPQVVFPPDRVINVNPPGNMEFIPIRHETGQPSMDDPSGIKSFMEFLGFDKGLISAAATKSAQGLDQIGGTIEAQKPGFSAPMNSATNPSATNLGTFNQGSSQLFPSSALMSSQQRIS